MRIRWVWLVMLSACGGAAGPAPAGSAREEDRIYRVGLERVEARAGDAHEMALLRDAYDAGFRAGGEEAAAVDARTSAELRRLGCRAILPEVELASAQAGGPRELDGRLCRLELPEDVAEAVHRGAFFATSRARVVSEAAETDDRGLGFLLVKAHEYGYERGFRRHRAGWTDAAARDLERSGCQEAVARAIAAGVLLEFDRARFEARCRAQPSIAEGALGPRVSE